MGQHKEQRRHFQDLFLFSSSTLARCPTEEIMLITSGLHREQFTKSEMISPST